MKRLVTVLSCAAIIAITASAAEARPHHKRHHHQKTVHQILKKKKVAHYRGIRLERVPARQFEQAQEQQSFFGGFQSGFQSGFDAGSGLVAKARQYIGATAREVGVRSTLWCSAFLRKLTGASGVDDRAISWENKRHIAPQVGAIVTMGRRGGGHVGVVSGFTPKGDPIVISGNHRNRVAETVYKRSRIRAWVSPS
ncbi:uncharacterized protein (TIGR02594 family) [Bradyrhizobium sp. AZCC 1610]|uniref:TIGR02594 family protein n=1 Tax=Bradyrhizobium sp. AZCC 1610 TaxID=3117020 RepID=UPI002FEFECBD